MKVKIFSAIVALTLILTYLGSIAIKLRDPALTIVMAIGLALMLVDLWQSLKSEND